MTEKAPVISPAELAALIGRAGAKGFAATPMGRALHGPESAGFRPADLVRRVVEDRVMEAVPAQDHEPAPEPPVIEPPPPPDIDRISAEAFAKGRAAGFAEGRTAAEAERKVDEAKELAAEIDLFRHTTHALRDSSAEAAVHLAQSLEAAVLRLASLRAGMAIDANPAPFAKRIADLAERIAQGLREVEIAVHPEDLAALKRHLPAQDLAMTANASLSRGDVAVRAQGISLSDLMLGEGDNQ